ncbi:hypothetical protein, partial [Staphylococcus aureus]|uniref:hypothetical protein n=1 Tax=Staphylococcus aureus TaxID=1280 RepID=UPI001C83CF49
VLPSTRVVNAPASFRFTVKRERWSSEVTSTELASLVATLILDCFKPYAESQYLKLPVVVLRPQVAAYYLFEQN